MLNLALSTFLAEDVLKEEDNRTEIVKYNCEPRRKESG